MCRQHGDTYINLKTGRCVLCGSRHYVRRMPRPVPQGVQQGVEATERSEMKEVRAT